MSSAPIVPYNQSAKTQQLLRSVIVGRLFENEGASAKEVVDALIGIAKMDTSTMRQGRSRFVKLQLQAIQMLRSWVDGDAPLQIEMESRNNQVIHLNAELMERARAVLAGPSMPAREVEVEPTQNGNGHANGHAKDT